MELCIVQMAEVVEIMDGSFQSLREDEEGEEKGEEEEEEDKVAFH